jgi:hypothetical protein
MNDIDTDWDYLERAADGTAALYVVRRLRRAFDRCIEDRDIALAEARHLADERYGYVETYDGTRFEVNG